MANLVVTLLFFLGFASCCAAAVFLLRRRRRQARRNLLPTHRQPLHQRQFTITTTDDFMKSPSTHVWEEKNDHASGLSSTPAQIPELRITFPDEDGDKGKGGRVVVVRVSDSGSVGMSPLNQESLPPYQASDSDRFQSLDLNRIGGLREKEPATQRWS